MFELRVLNGLHEGAALPLSGKQWSIGNATESELQLCDNGIKPRHCQLTLTDAGWQISPVEGSICNREGERVALPFLLQPGEIFTLSGVWLSLDDAATPWRETPVEIASAPVTPTAPETRVNASTPAKSRKSLFARILPRWAQITTVSLLLLLTFTITSWVLQPGVAQQNDDESQLIKPQLPDTAALRSVLEQKLRERELLSRVQLTSSAHGITINGDLPQDQLPIVQRMVKMIRDDYQLGVTLNDETKVKSVSLPFRIIQITSGSHANIVTEGGQRLFIGDERDGLRLTSITADQIEFGGRENITVKW
ncbi:type III secretion protein D [Paramixta manurensis]|uniref:Type III secretion protein D n=1 Tax=Paramixta manurensis TaxID=2740817 RepID=A0A6M8UBQ1_9GAMM|nr:type III secretion protein D [Erwiniaceae bacterium PD-1]